MALHAEDFEIRIGVPFRVVTVIRFPRAASLAETAMPPSEFFPAITPAMIAARFAAAFAMFAGSKKERFSDIRTAERLGTCHFGNRQRANRSMQTSEGSSARATPSAVSSALKVCE